MKSSKVLIKHVAAVGIKYAAAIGIALAGLTGCSSLQQDVVISTIPSEEKSEVSDYEFRLAFLDAKYSFDKKEYYTADETKEITDACNALLKDVRKSLSKTTLVNATLARLRAIEGRILLIEGNSEKAAKSYNASLELYNGDIQQIILGHRLGIIDNLASANYAKADKPLILLEQALDFYKNKEYVSAVAKFDESFISAESFYNDAYKELRDNAWNLRSVTDDSALSSLLAVKNISVGQMMLITQESERVIEFYTGDKRYTEQNLFYKLVQKGLITPAAKENAPKNIYAYTKVSRAMQARYLWNIYCDLKQKPALKNRYSNLYSSSDKDSPIKDVSVTDDDFDAILGCIEYGLMNLTDGINFNPSASVSGIEFNDSLTKLKNKFHY